MKKLDLGQTINTFANIGVIAGIIFLGIELRQNNALLGAQARATRAQVRIDGNDLYLSNPHLISVAAKQISGESLSLTEQMTLRQMATGVFVRWEYVCGEFREGLIDAESIPVQNWRSLVESAPNMKKEWEESGRFSYHPDFVQWMDENVVNER